MRLIVFQVISALPSPLSLETGQHSWQGREARPPSCRGSDMEKGGLSKVAHA